MDKYFEEFITNAKQEVLARFIKQYELWIIEQLKKGGLIFPPSDYYNIIQGG